MRALLATLLWGWAAHYNAVTRAFATPEVWASLDSMFTWSVAQHKETGRCVDGLQLLDDSTVLITHLRVLKVSRQDSISMWFEEECPHTVHTHFMPPPWLEASPSPCDQSTAAKLKHSVDFVLSRGPVIGLAVTPYHATTYDPDICP